MIFITGFEIWPLKSERILVLVEHIKVVLLANTNETTSAGIDVDKDPAMSPKVAIQPYTITVRRAVKRLLKAPASGPETQYKKTLQQVSIAQMKNYDEIYMTLLSVRGKIHKTLLG